MKFSLFFILGLFLSTLLFSQTKYDDDFSYSISRPYKVVDAKHKFYFQQGDEVMAIKAEQREKITIQKFSTDPLKQKSVKETKISSESMDFETIIEFKKRYYYFYTRDDKSRAGKSLYYREIDFATGEFITKSSRLISPSREVAEKQVAFFNIQRYGSFQSKRYDYYLSHDESKLLIKYRLAPKFKNNDRNYDEIGFVVFDENLTEISNAEIKMPYKESGMQLLDCAIDSEGNTYLLANAFIDGSGKTKIDKNGNVNYHIELFRLAPNSSEIDITKIDVDGKVINSIRLFEDPEGFMIAAGYYTIGRWVHVVDGVFSFKINPEEAIYDINSYEIPLSVLNQNERRSVQNRNSRREKSDKAGFEHLQLSNLLVQDDGSMILVGEQYFVQQTNTGNNFRSSSNTFYFYNDLLVTKLEKDGRLAWMKKLPKTQKKSGSGWFWSPDNQGGLSYKYIKDEKNNQYYFLFLDNVNNLDLPPNKAPKIHEDGRGGFLTAYKLNDEDGAYDKISIFDLKDVMGINVFQFRPSRIIQVAPNEFVVEVYKKGKEDLLIKMVLESK